MVDTDQPQQPVQIRWTAETLRRGTPQEGFATPATFENRDESQSIWSLVIEPSGPVNADGTQSARVQFLMDNAPHDWLESGQRFNLIPPGLGDGFVK
jgi:hypothetical protein